jgi:CO/xanthine dehydrogenase FAD-binding subunit
MQTVALTAARRRALAEFLLPRDLAEAVALASGGVSRFAAGCTDLFPATEGTRLQGRVIDLTGVPELQGILRTGRGWRIGGGATWAEVISADLPPAFDGLKAAARQVGGVQIQNAGTIGGNLCNASPAADGLPPLLTLDPAVEIAGPAGARLVPLAQFVTGPRRTLLRPGEIVVALHVPEDAGAGRGAFAKLGARAHLVISIVMVAVRVETAGGRITRAAVAVGACGPVAVRLPAVEAALAGCAAEAAAAAGCVTEDRVLPALSPIDDIRADAAYRRQAAVELIRRTLGAALSDPARQSVPA